MSSDRDLAKAGLAAGITALLLGSKGSQQQVINQSNTLVQPPGIITGTLLNPKFMDFSDALGAGTGIGMCNNDMTNFSVGMSLSSAGSIRTDRPYSEVRQIGHFWALTGLAVGDSWQLAPIAVTQLGPITLPGAITLTPGNTPIAFELNLDSDWQPIGSVMPAGLEISISRLYTLTNPKIVVGHTILLMR